MGKGEARKVPGGFHLEHVVAVPSVPMDGAFILGDRVTTKRKDATTTYPATTRATGRAMYPISTISRLGRPSEQRSRHPWDRGPARARPQGRRRSG